MELKKKGLMLLNLDLKGSIVKKCRSWRSKDEAFHHVIEKLDPTGSYNGRPELKVRALTTNLTEHETL